MMHTSKIMPATSPYLAKQMLLFNVSARILNILKFIQNGFSTYSILAYLFTAVFCDYLITSYCVYA